jgi:polyhydroxybutyrate depolymerase
MKNTFRRTLPLIALALVTLLVVLFVVVAPARAARNKRRFPRNPTASSSTAKPARALNWSMSVDGRTRTARLFVPRHLVSDSLPLVVVMHGGKGSAEKMEGYTGFKDVAAANGFAVVFPDGVDGNWNDGRDTNNSPDKQNIDDVTFIGTLINDIASQGDIDRTRVFATGMSNGAMMSVRLACDATELFAGIAAVAGTGPADFAQRCKPSRAIPLLQIHGTADPLVPFNGGTVETLGQDGGEVTGVDTLAAFFVSLNGCGADPTVGVLPDVNARDRTTISTRVWSSCKANTVFWRVEGGGHTWPGERKSLPRFLVGPTNKDIDATTEIWKFFASLPSRP